MESATPAVDRPFVEVDGKEVDKGVVIPLSTLARSPAATLPLLFSLIQKNISYTRKEDYQRYFTVYTTERGNSVPKGLNISPSNNNIYVEDVRLRKE